LRPGLSPGRSASSLGHLIEARSVCQPNPRTFFLHSRRRADVALRIEPRPRTSTLPLWSALWLFAAAALPPTPTLYRPLVGASRPAGHFYFGRFARGGGEFQHNRKEHPLPAAGVGGAEPALRRGRRSARHPRHQGDAVSCRADVDSPDLSRPRRGGDKPRRAPPRPPQGRCDRAAARARLADSGASPHSVRPEGPFQGAPRPEPPPERSPRGTTRGTRSALFPGLVARTCAPRPDGRGCGSVPVGTAQGGRPTPRARRV
jgi:hypothetical protein